MSKIKLRNLKGILLVIGISFVLAGCSDEASKAPEKKESQIVVVEDKDETTSETEETDTFDEDSEEIVANASDDTLANVLNITEAGTESEESEGESEEDEEDESDESKGEASSEESDKKEKDKKVNKDNKDNKDNKEKGPLKTEDGKTIIDLVFFVGQSNMSGCGGNAAYAPKVEEGHGYEFRAISDPTRLYPIVEPFGVNENSPNAIMDFPGGKRGSIVSAFANKYYEETGVPIVAVSASSGGTNTSFWLSSAVTYDLGERLKRAQVWLESNDYYIRKQYVLWLQGESDAIVGVTSEQYNDNMDNIIRPLFIGGVQKVFFITPGRTISRNQYFNDVIAAQLEMSKKSGYYGLATTVLTKVSTEYMVDEWHYNQTVLNLVGEEAAKSVAYYTNNKKEACIYDYKNDETFIPDGFDYSDDIKVKPIDVNGGGYLSKVPAGQ